MVIAISLLVCTFVVLLWLRNHRTVTPERPMRVSMRSDRLAPGAAGEGARPTAAGTAALHHEIFL